MTDQERPSECKCVETDAGMVGVYDCPLHSASPEPVPEKNDSIEAEAECLAEATGIPASVFREAMYPPEPVPEQERPETTEERYLHAMYDALRELDAHAEVSGDEYLGGAARPILRGVLEAANYPTPLHIDDDSELMQATREALSEHGAEGDEEERPHVAIHAYVCPEPTCGFRSLEPGPCRSHPYPLRAMGPEMVLVEVVPASALDTANARADSLQAERATIGEQIGNLARQQAEAEALAQRYREQIEAVIDDLLRIGAISRFDLPVKGRTLIAERLRSALTSTEAQQPEGRE
jgi:hypothetical protein